MPPSRRARRRARARRGRRRPPRRRVLAPSRPPSPPGRAPPCQRWGTLSVVELVRTPEERFADLPGFPFEARYADLHAGVRMHYVDEGPSRAETVFLLHGQPTWGYLYRSVVAGLVARGLRAVVPDLIGFGRSDKPVARTDHSVEAHVDWITQFADSLGLSRLTVVA